ncbi:endonuclease/exonuclease/phosphatase family protein [Toxoplasma gondii VEG]|uniref:Endonuclease/exonuclease/phosphatase domain-containing protein n=2 Tax=Toxoplasma gondii TaxID=5811 RepID=B9Q678_TOXGV|nr:endonuclease/exonuclease/phosphatase family protein [Toxoplasma gondii VEG]KFG52019.1 endonuclease/exonuclease/phosphatase family protein [Toxoplasma gondii p89]CEL75264.1 TPA: endonuclease/exonuclease/phosphatase domain-containing protein [Toxoplasma gondii VEG]
MERTEEPCSSSFAMEFHDDGAGHRATAAVGSWNGEKMSFPRQPLAADFDWHANRALTSSVYTAEERTSVSDIPREASASGASSGSTSAAPDGAGSTLRMMATSAVRSVPPSSNFNCLSYELEAETVGRESDLDASSRRLYSATCPKPGKDIVSPLEVGGFPLCPRSCPAARGPEETDRLRSSLPRTPTPNDASATQSVDSSGVCPPEPVQPTAEPRRGPPRPELPPDSLLSLGNGSPPLSTENTVLASSQIDSSLLLEGGAPSVSGNVLSSSAFSSSAFLPSSPAASCADASPPALPGISPSLDFSIVPPASPRAASVSFVPSFLRTNTDHWKSTLAEPPLGPSANPVSPVPPLSPPSSPSSLSPPCRARIAATPVRSSLSDFAVSPRRPCFSVAAAHAVASTPKAPVDASREALFYPSYTRRESSSTASLGPVSRLDSVVIGEHPVDFAPVDSINIVSFNAGLLEYRLCGIQIYQNPPFTRRRLSHIPISLLDTNSDIICLQEVYDDLHADFLVDSMRHVFPYVGRRTSGGRFALHNGLMVLSRFPIRHTQFHPFHDVTNIERLFGSKGMLECGIDIPGVGVVAIFNIHLASGAVDPESPYVEALRSAEIQQVLSACEDAGLRGEIPVVVGDLNAAPDLCASNYKSFVERGWRDCWLQVHGDRDMLLRHHLVHQQQMLLQQDLHPDLLEERQKQVQLELEHLLHQHKVQQRMLADDLRLRREAAALRGREQAQELLENPDAKLHVTPAAAQPDSRGRVEGACERTDKVESGVGGCGVEQGRELRELGEERVEENDASTKGSGSVRERVLSGGERARQFLEAEVSDGYHPLPPNGDTGDGAFRGRAGGEERRALLPTSSGASHPHVVLELGTFFAGAAAFDESKPPGGVPATPHTTASTCAQVAGGLVETDADARDASCDADAQVIGKERDLEQGECENGETGKETSREPQQGKFAFFDRRNTSGDNRAQRFRPESHRLLSQALLTTHQVEMRTRQTRRSLSGWEINSGLGGSAIADDSEATTTDDAEECLLRRKGDRPSMTRSAFCGSSLLSSAAVVRSSTPGPEEDWSPREDFTWDPQNPLNSIGPHAGCHGLRCDYVFLPPQRLAGALRDFVPVSGEILLREPRVMVDACCFGCLGQVMLVTLSDHYALRISLKRSAFDETLSHSPSMVLALKEANLFYELPGAVLSDEAEDEAERAEGDGEASRGCGEETREERSCERGDERGDERSRPSCLLTGEREDGI